MASKGLWNRDFSLLSAGLLISYIGDAFFNVGFIWLALTISGNPGIAGTLMAVYGLPPLLLGPFVGAVVDSWNKRWIMIISDGIRGVVILGIYLLFLANALSLWVLFGGVLFLSICDTLYKPSLRVLVPGLIPAEALRSANSFIQGSQQFAQIVGAGLAGVVIVSMGTEIALLVDGISFLVSALVLVAVRFPASLLVSKRLSVGSFLGDTWEGIRFSFGRVELLSVMVLIFSMNLFLSPVNVIFPIYSRDTIGAGPEGFAWLSGSIGVGMVLGSLLVGTIGKRLNRSTSITLGISGMALAFLGLGVAGTLPVALAFTVALGATAPFIQVPLVTQLQQEVEPHIQGRVFATLATVSTASVPLGSALAGSALQFIQPQVVFRITTAGLFAIYAVLMLYQSLTTTRRQSAVTK